MLQQEELTEEKKEEETIPIETPVIDEEEDIPNTRRKSLAVSFDYAKELAKQQKANRDEKRSSMDARHHYIMTRISEALSIDVLTVEEFIVDDEKFGLFEEFFGLDGTQKLMFFYQEQKKDEELVDYKKLFLTNGNEEPAANVVLLFMRSSNAKKITTSNIESETSFMFFNVGQSSILQCFQDIISKIFVPTLRAQQSLAVTHELSANKKEDFIESVEEFAANIGAIHEHTSSFVKLSASDHDELLESLMPDKYREILNNKELMTSFEAIMMIWNKQIELILVEAEQVRRETDNSGPSVELAYWRSRMTKFNSLVEQLKTPRVRNLVNLINLAKLKPIRKWKELDGQITDSANEAKDNVKYLFTLNNFFGPLSKSNPISLLDYVPNLMNTIRMIYCISSYYNSSERMTALFSKVTNQMVSSCKAYLKQGVSTLWDLKFDVLEKRIQDCLNLNEAYIGQFKRTKEKLSTIPGEKQFEFSENYIFGKFDTFVRRLNKILNLVHWIKRLERLPDLKVDGCEGFIGRYKSLCETIKKKPYDPMDHRKQEFDQDYEIFNNLFEELVNDLEIFIDSWLKKNISCDQKMSIISRFRILNPEIIDLDAKYMKILDDFSIDIDNVRDIYLAEKLNPPVSRNLPPIAGRIAWSRQLFNRLETPMLAFSNYPDLLKTMEGRKVVRNYNKMATVLIEYELLYYRGWTEAVDVIRSGLNSSLLVRGEESEKIYVNFDPQILELLHEAKYLKKMGLEIPENAILLCRCETKLKRYRERLLEMLKEYTNMVSNIPTCLQPLMRPHLTRLLEAFSPGFTSITWTSIKIDEFIDQAKEKLSEISRMSELATDAINFRIEQQLSNISNFSICPLPATEPFTPKEFLMYIEKTVSENAVTLAKMSLSIENSVNEVIEMLKSPLSEEELELAMKTQNKELNPYASIMNNFALKNTDAFTKCTKQTLETFKKRLLFDKFNKSNDDHVANALLMVDIILSLPNLEISPPLNDVQTFLNKAVQSILKMTKEVPQWQYLQQINNELKKKKVPTATLR